jgi:coenzyme F420-reducing hydrogenase delta subunit
MAARSDGKRYELEAVVDSDLCARCGICVGACPTATPFRKEVNLIPGIDLPAHTAKHMKLTIDEAARAKEPVIAFGCSGSDELSWLRAKNVPCVEVACTGQVPPPYLDYILSKDLAKQVLMAGCGGSCRYRYGESWTEERIARTRDPNLRRRVGRHRIRLAWQSSASLATQLQELQDAAKNNEEES